MEDIYVNKAYVYKDFKAAIHTLKASRWELLKARLFGTKSVHSDGTIRVTTVDYNGKTYLFDYGKAI
jgi:hypothetical protein